MNFKLILGKWSIELYPIFRQPEDVKKRPILFRSHNVCGGNTGRVHLTIKYHELCLGLPGIHVPMVQTIPRSEVYYER